MFQIYGAFARFRTGIVIKERNRKAVLNQAVQILFFRFRLFDEHYGDFIANRINESAFGIDAFQTALVGFYFDLRLAVRTAQDF